MPYKGKDEDAEELEMCTMKMLPELENCDENVDASSLQSSISKRANSTRQSLKELSEEVQQRFQPIAHLHRIQEDEMSTTPNSSRPRKQIYQNPITNLEHNKPGGSKRPSEVMSDGQRSNWSQSVERIEVAINRNYYTIAYSIVIVAYLAGFAEYLYFRLTSIILPQHLIFHPPCEGKSTRKIGKDGFHYGVSLFAFIGIAIFQLMCFFGLTISEKWTECKDNPRENEQAARRQEFATFIRKMLKKTMYRVFICYGVCSLINCALIFYMVGIQDSLGDTVSNVFLYIFDAVVILYFIAFPLTTIVYHPYIHCFKKSNRLPARFAMMGAGPRTQTSTLESNVSESNDMIPPEIPKLNFSRQDPTRQHILPHRSPVVRSDSPVLEEYLHSPRRQIAPHNPLSNTEDDDKMNNTPKVTNERLTTFV